MNSKKESKNYGVEWDNNKVDNKSNAPTPLDIQKCNHEDFVKALDIGLLEAEIRRVNALLRENHKPHTYHQNKKYLERLERKLRECQRQKKN